MGEMHIDELVDRSVFERELGFVPDYSDDLGSAWGVVEEMRSRGCLFTLSSTPHGTWVAKFEKSEIGADSAEAGSVELAICIAALSIVGVSSADISAAARAVSDA